MTKGYSYKMSQNNLRKWVVSVLALISIISFIIFIYFGHHSLSNASYVTNNKTFNISSFGLLSFNNQSRKEENYLRSILPISNNSKFFTLFFLQ
jgi:hypothetical protein